MHRRIINAPKNIQVDHINGDSLDNRRENLRLCTKSENQRNSIKSAKAYSRYKGVNFYKKSERWMAQIFVDKKIKYLGSFSNESDAACAYNMAALRYFREFANLNLIGEINVEA